MNPIGHPIRITGRRDNIKNEKSRIFGGAENHDYAISLE
jgi:hypothetical protein